MKRHTPPFCDDYSLRTAGRTAKDSPSSTLTLTRRPARAAAVWRSGDSGTLAVPVPLGQQLSTTYRQSSPRRALRSACALSLRRMPGTILLFLWIVGSVAVITIAKQKYLRPYYGSFDCCCVLDRVQTGLSYNDPTGESSARQGEANLRPPTHTRTAFVNIAASGRTHQCLYSPLSELLN